jgi:hypothetical protein
MAEATTRSYLDAPAQRLDVGTARLPRRRYSVLAQDTAATRATSRSPTARASTSWG